ncbi:S8 family serine peptidase [Sphingomonas lacunae]|uniref:S8 family serine peptidase n=1 Tax=Sphingomonas lacunae TaxID=2698828 RepID=A0A6M4AS83_9SPHN|nr:S8 family peptidase [Sphingomonas lacunae]QJQ31925.1 S8 family serine peptidase [Sphingomonas lacunae]
MTARFRPNGQERRRFFNGTLPIGALLLGGCGGAGQTAPSVIAAPPPPAVSTPAPTPTPPSVPVENFNTQEYLRSDGANYHDASIAWGRGVSGAGVTVAIIDSGIDADSPEFAGRLHPMSADVAGGARGFDDVGSDGHGTNVAQLLLGARNDRGTVGIAWGATLLALRADRPGSCLDGSASGRDRGCRFSDVAIAAGLDRAVSAGTRIVNISLGGGAPTSVLLDAVDRATAAGVLIIVSAGNNGESTDPAVDPSNPDPFARAVLQAGNGLVIVAGANSETGAISSFSNRAGASASNYLLALGDRLCCDYDNGDLRREVTTDGSFVFVVSGTSYSAPQIAGAATLLAQAFPNLSGKQIVDLLLTTATDVGPLGTDSVNGRGILNIPRAFAPQGATTLAGTSIALPADRLLGGYSGAMGDAAVRDAAPAVMLDGYQRAYELHLNRLMAMPMNGRPALFPALAARGRDFSAGGSAVAFSVSVDPGRGHADLMPLHVGPDQRHEARLLAGSMIMRLSSVASVGLSANRSVDALTAMMGGRDGNAFVVADPAYSARLLGFRSVTGSAVRVAVAPGSTLAVSAEQGDVDALLRARRQHDPAMLDRQSRYALWSFGVDRTVVVGSSQWEGRLTATMLTENASLLGARWSALLGGAGARSVLIDGHARVELGQRSRIDLQWREGWTHARSAGLVAGSSPIRTRAWALDVAQRDLLVAGDHLALRVAQPLRVEAGGLLLDVPTGYDYATLMATHGRVTMPLAPVGREHVVEAAWTVPAWGGVLTLNGFWRDEPGHVQAAGDDLGAAVRFALGF